MKVVSTRRRNKPKEFSKKIAEWVFIGGIIMVQECLILIAYAIHKDFTATAAYLTAAIGVGDYMIAAVITKYLGLAKSDHRKGGITYDAAQAAGFSTSQASGTQDDEASI